MKLRSGTKVLKAVAAVVLAFTISTAKAGGSGKAAFE